MKSQTKTILKLSIFILVAFAIVFGLSTPALAGVSYACNYHAYRDCVGSAIYWYDACANRQDLAQDCASFNLTCQYGQCVVKTVQPPNNYVSHYRTACRDNNIYWYDSLGASSGLYKSCSDTNSCTIDTCSSKRCSNTLKCDGSTCATGSADYNSHCAINVLSVTFLAKKDSSATQWDKTIQFGSNGNAYFLITIVNSSNAQVEGVSVKTNIPTEVGYLGNLKVNDVAISGDIVSGVNVGSLAPGATKVVTFEGKTQILSVDASKNATAIVTAGSTTQSDSVTINFNSAQIQPAAAVSSAPTTSGFWTFLKRWYLWILVLLVLIFLFIVVFRRLSSNT